MYIDLIFYPWKIRHGFFKANFHLLSMPWKKCIVECNWKEDTLSTRKVTTTTSNLWKKRLGLCSISSQGWHTIVTLLTMLIYHKLFRNYKTCAAIKLILEHHLADRNNERRGQICAGLKILVHHRGLVLVFISLSSPPSFSVIQQSAQNNNLQKLLFSFLKSNYCYCNSNFF